MATGVWGTEKSRGNKVFFLRYFVRNVVPVCGFFNS